MKKVIVIGGAGFLGSALASSLRKVDIDIRILDLIAHPDPTIPSIIGNLQDPSQVHAACEGVDTVFQTASLVDWGVRSREKLYATNVEGNRNVISVCRDLGITRLIYTSSIDVVFNGHPITNGDESIPYPLQHLDDYGTTKMIAEKEVLAANDPNGLRTCALRTAGIYGPGDRHRLPSIISAARSGQLIRLGDGSSRFSHVYLANVVHAHILAAHALDAAVSGNAYFITDHEPINFFDFFIPYLTALELPIPKRSIPYHVAYGLAWLMETAARIGIGPQKPTLTRYVVASTCLDFNFSHAKATKDFGYQPIVSFEQAQVETINDFVNNFV